MKVTRNRKKRAKDGRKRPYEDILIDARLNGYSKNDFIISDWAEHKIYHITFTENEEKMLLQVLKERYEN